MKLLFLILSFGLLIIAPVSAQNTKQIQQTVEQIAQKYRTLDAQADYVKANGVPIAKETRFIQPEDEVVEEYSSLKQIALVRHGEPDINKTGKFSHQEAQRYVTRYDSVGIVVPDKPFFEIKDPKEVAIFSSSVQRAQATAQYLFGDSTEMEVSRDFREFETRIGKRAIKLRLPIKLWTTSARIKWMLGLGRGEIESFADAKNRAQKAAELIADATEERPKVVLVAHGFLNRYIKEELQGMGWHVVKDGGSSYFATTVLVKIDPEKKQKEQASHESAGQ
ncbi:histidine phosphatase family protein [Pontibacter harenae]|uniref:histidine phosphatase family protein n=1 Tax=Pontibacter harenae TaxID=2894083 RepID=UPI001E37E28E|nr:phosphoglycerate mutase family protein [Pontibacter harenae]MCC9165634.1 histidine phosphatase family protein [Pontibacter harenae]